MNAIIYTRAANIIIGSTMSTNIFDRINRRFGDAWLTIPHCFGNGFAPKHTANF